jgi:hypothetical protein
MQGANRFIRVQKPHKADFAVRQRNSLLKYKAADLAEGSFSIILSIDIVVAILESFTPQNYTGKQSGFLSHASAGLAMGSIMYFPRFAPLFEAGASPHEIFFYISPGPAFQYSNTPSLQYSITPLVLLG